MRVTVKGQVTIPKYFREKLGIVPNSEIEFKEENNRVYLLQKTGGGATQENKFHRYRGAATVKMSTDEIMALTRG